MQNTSAKAEGTEALEDTTEDTIEDNDLQLETTDEFKEYESTQKINYLCEPILNSELILFNNSKLLKNALKKNIGPLSLNKSLKRHVNKKITNKKSKDFGKFEINGDAFTKLHNKMVFLTAIPKYNDSHLEEIMDLREQYEKLDADDSPGLQKIKRDIRNRIRDLSRITYIHRDKNVFGGMVMVVMNKIITRPNFSGYSYKPEMKSLATEHIFKYTWRFASYKQSQISGQFVSAFTYISTIIFNAFVATINKQNDEIKKIKNDFLETQKMKHREPNRSTYGLDASEIDKSVQIININTTLFEEIKKIKIDVGDILIKYPDDYKISMEEYTHITEYTKDNRFNISLVRNGGSSV